MRIVFWMIEKVGSKGQSAALVVEGVTVTIVLYALLLVANAVIGLLVDTLAVDCAMVVVAAIMTGAAISMIILAHCGLRVGPCIASLGILVGCVLAGVVLNLKPLVLMLIVLVPAGAAYWRIRLLRRHLMSTSSDGVSETREQVALVFLLLFEVLFAEYVLWMT